MFGTVVHAEYKDPDPNLTNTKSANGGIKTGEDRQCIDKQALRTWIPDCTVLTTNGVYKHTRQNCTATYTLLKLGVSEFLFFTKEKRKGKKLM